MKKFAHSVEGRGGVDRNFGLFELSARASGRLPRGGVDRNETHIDDGYCTNRRLPRREGQTARPTSMHVGFPHSPIGISQAESGPNSHK